MSRYITVGITWNKKAFLKRTHVSIHLRVIYIKRARLYLLSVKDLFKVDITEEDLMSVQNWQYEDAVFRKLFSINDVLEGYARR